jgi:hypothetical protein
MKNLENLLLPLDWQIRKCDGGPERDSPEGFSEPVLTGSHDGTQCTWG